MPEEEKIINATLRLPLSTWESLEEIAQGIGTNRTGLVKAIVSGKVKLMPTSQQLQETLGKPSIA